MEEYKCIKCNKSFKQKVHLQAHENKKFSCNITKVIECEHCKKKFTITTTLKSHLILCKVKIQLDEANKLKLMEDKIVKILPDCRDFAHLLPSVNKTIICVFLFFMA